MNWSKIICIELKKYNNQQLDVICEQLNFPTGSLTEFKESGTIRLFYELDMNYVIGGVKREDLKDRFVKPLYKNLYLNSNYSYLTKKEKDKLLRIQPMEFNTKKKSTKPVLITEISNKNSKKTEKIAEVLEVDAILDKIYKFGMSSLSKSEKDFLDNESKK